MSVSTILYDQQTPFFCLFFLVGKFGPNYGTGPVILRLFFKATPLHDPKTFHGIVALPRYRILFQELRILEKIDAHIAAYRNIVTERSPQA